MKQLNPTIAAVLRAAGNPPCMGQTARAALPLCTELPEGSAHKSALPWIYTPCLKRNNAPDQHIPPLELPNIPAAVLLEQQPQPWRQQGAYQLGNVQLRVQELFTAWDSNP